jgi:hypothetical protein
MLTYGRCSTYFNTCQSTTRLFDDHSRLSCQIKQSTYDALALRHAICAHAVQNCPQFSAWAASNMEAIAPGTDYKGVFYQLAREALGKCDLEEKHSRPTLQALQATLLIGLHELQHAEFARAWLTAGRVHWLTQILQLRTLDSADQVQCMEDQYLEEKRKALWAANGLACFLMGGGILADSVNINEVSNHSHSSPWIVHDLMRGTDYNIAATVLY